MTQRGIRKLEEDPVLTQIQSWQDAEGGRAIEASVALIQQALTPKGKAPFTTAECLMLMLNCKASGLDPFRKQMMLVRFAEGGAATLITAYQTFLAAADRSGSYLPPDLFIKQDEKGRPLYGWARAQRSNWPEGVYQYYPAQGNVLMFEQVARYKPQKSGGGLMATWAGPAAYHQFWKTLFARIVRATWPAATERMYLAEEFGGEKASAEPAVVEAEYHEPPEAPTQPEIEVPEPPAPDEPTSQPMPEGTQDAADEAKEPEKAKDTTPPPEEATASPGGSDDADWEQKTDPPLAKGMDDKELKAALIAEFKRASNDTPSIFKPWVKARHMETWTLAQLVKDHREAAERDLDLLRRYKDGALEKYDGGELPPVESE